MYNVEAHELFTSVEPFSKLTVLLKTFCTVLNLKFSFYYQHIGNTIFSSNTFTCDF